MSSYRGAVTILALLTILLGLGMLTFTIRHGGGVGILLGLLFVAAGAGRLYLMRRQS